MFNQIQLIGRMTADAKSSKLENGKTAVYGTIALSETYKVKNSYFFDFFKICENDGLCKVLTKGKLIVLCGSLIEKKVELKGTDKKVQRVSIRVSNVEFLESKPKDEKKEDESVTDDLPF